MLKIIPLIFASTFFLHSIIAQDFEWSTDVASNSTSGSNYMSPEQMIRDYDGNFIVVGRFYGVVDFDPGPSDFIMTSANDWWNVGNTDFQSTAFIQKLDPNGNFIWAKKLKTTGSSTIHDVAVDTDGNLYVIGKYSDRVQLEPFVDHYTPFGTNVFTVKYDPNGNAIWSGEFGGGLSNDTGNGIAVDSLDKVYITGQYHARADFVTGTDLAPAGDYRMYLLIQNKADGSVEDFTGFGVDDLSGGTMEGNDITLDFSNNFDYPDVLVTGNFSGNVNFKFSGSLPDDFRTDNGTEDVFVLKFNLNNPIYSWARTWGSVNGDAGIKINVDQYGSVYTSGDGGGSMDFDPDPVAVFNASGNSFTQKMDSTGIFQWVNGFSAGSFYDAKVTDAGEVYTTGRVTWATSDMDGDPNVAYNLTTNGGNDIFIRRIKPTGELDWARVLGNWGDDRGLSLEIDSMDNFYLLGRYVDTVDFDLGLDTAALGQPDLLNYGIFLSKYNRCNAVNIASSDQTCDGYYVYNGQNIYNSGAYSFNYHDFGACDTIETLTLDIGSHTTSSVTVFGACDSLEMNGQTYYTSGTYVQTIPNAEGCDSTITLTLTVNYAPTLSLSLSTNDSLCDGESVSITASGAVGYAWSNGAGNVSTINETPTITTTYVVTGTTLSCPTTDSVTITVFPVPTVVSSADASFCLGDSTVLTANGADSYLWSNSLGTDSIITITPNSTTTYTVTGTTNGCSDSDQSVVTVNNYPNLTVSSDTSICQGQSITLTSTGASSYLWDNGAGSSSSVTVTPTATTTYSVIGSTNGCADTLQTTVTYSSSPPPTITNSGDTSICDGDSITIFANGADSYSWNQGLGTDSVILINPSNTTVYTVVGTTNNCHGSSQFEVTVFGTPSPVISWTGTELTTSWTGTYQWYLDGVELTGETNQSIIPDSNGTYTVEVENSNGCVGVSNEYVFNSLSLNELDALSVTVYPNPFINDITVNGKNIINVSIYNSIGEMVYTYEFNKNNNGKVDLRSLSTGVYIAYIYADEYVKAFKLIKE